MTSAKNQNITLIQAVPVRHPGRWISAAIVAVLAIMLAHGLVTNDKFQWATVFEYLFKPQVIQSVGVTIGLTFGAMAIGIVLALTAAIMRRSDNPVLRYVATAYIWFFRGTPIYTQLMLWGLVGILYEKISLGIPFGPEFFSFETFDVITPLVAALLGLGLNEGAYLSEIFRSGFNSVDAGQAEAAEALGMSKGQILRTIILPQAMRVIVPPTGNETISMLKTTSLVLAVPFNWDLTYVTNALGSASFQPIPFLIVAALWYLFVTTIFMIGQHYLERYYGKGEAASSSPGKGKTKKVLSQRQAAIKASQTVTDDPFIEFTP